MSQPSDSKLIESENDKYFSGQLSISSAAGGLQFRNMSECMEFAKLMAVSGHAVPRHLRGQVGACLGIVIQAIEWRMSPYAVAAKSYVVNDVLAYESQLIHAVIEQRAPITSRLRHEFSGSGPKRRCKVWASVRGESQPLVYESQEYGEISPKNSPLWKTKPDLQLYYNTSRDWARVYFPDVLLGVYAEDEISAVAPPDSSRQANSLAALTERLNNQASADRDLEMFNAAPEPEPPEQGEPSGDEQFDSDESAFASCRTLEQVARLESELVATREMTEGERASVGILAEQARDRILSSRGSLWQKR